jgi:hypothetical protein
MPKFATAVPLLIATILLTATAAGARVVVNTIGAAAALVGDGHAARGTILLDCTAGQQVQFTLTLVQNGASGTGYGAGVCTGNLTEYEITVPAESDTFTVGMASACATAVNYRHGVIVDTREWCRSAGVLLVAD